MRSCRNNPLHCIYLQILCTGAAAAHASCHWSPWITCSLSSTAVSAKLGASPPQSSPALGHAPIIDCLGHSA